MNLHRETIEKAERRYATKAEAYFYGMYGGVLMSAIAVFLAILVSWAFHK